MIVKTKQFENKLLSDLKYISINKNIPLKIKGSYKRKTYGDYISDIDLEALVYYNQNLLKVLTKILYNKKNPFFFNYMSCGTYDDFKLPWNFDINGTLSQHNIKKWFNDFSKLYLVPKNILNNIEKKLINPSIRDLVDIEMILKPFSSIIWSRKDIRNGYKEFRNKNYYILEEIKNETPVLEFMYKYKDQFIPIDVGLIDRKFKSPIKEKMYKFYTEDWYKIIKSFKWKLIPDKNVQEYYTKLIQNVTPIIAINYQIGLFMKMYFYPKIKNKLRINIIKDLKRLRINYRKKDIREIQFELENKVNNYLSSRYDYFINYLKPEFIIPFKLNIYKGKKAQIPLSQNEIFFKVKNEDFEKIGDLALRLSLNIDFVLKCFFECALKMKKPLKDIIKLVIANNNFSIDIFKNYIILYKNFVPLKKINKNKLKFIRTMIITKKY